MIREGDEVGDHTQQAVREELLVCGNSSKNLVLKDGNVHEELEQRKGKEGEAQNNGGCLVASQGLALKAAVFKLLAPVMNAEELHSSLLLCGAGVRTRAVCAKHTILSP